MPLVSIVCLSHNHEEYIEEAIHSVLNQTYKEIEIILVDDASTDNSKAILQSIADRKDIQFIDLRTPHGNCSAFNKALHVSSGEYIIDLSCDDVLLPERVERGLQTFKGKNVGIEFCNVLNIDPNGLALHTHFSDAFVAEGDLYKTLIQKYHISPPGMMTKRSVLEELGGYDESLTYEDFDFWIRSSRKHAYGYTDSVLVKKRNVPHSLSKKQFKFLTRHQKSTLMVCQKIQQLNQTKEEKNALRMRVIYELKNCLKQGNLHLVPAFAKLLV